MVNALTGRKYRGHCPYPLDSVPTYGLYRPTMSITQLTDATFNEVVQAADTPVLVEFGATWCGPCKMLEPILAELADEQEGRVLVATIDIDDNLATAPPLEALAPPPPHA